MLLVLSIAQPFIAQTVTTYVADAAVDHGQLAMVALVDEAEIADADGVVIPDLHPCFFQSFAIGLSVPSAARAIEKHPHLHAFLSFPDQRIGHPFRQRPASAEERLEGDGLFRVVHVLEQSIPECAVLQKLDAIAVDDRPLGDSGDRGHENLVGALAFLEREMRPLPALDRPDDHDQRDDGDDEKDQHPHRYGDLHSLSRSFRSTTMAQWSDGP